MNPTEQTTLVIGNTYYLKRYSVFRACVLRSLTSTPGFPDTAQVRYSNSDIEPTICRQSELLTEEQYKAVLAQRRKEVDRRIAAIKYAAVVTHWNEGSRTAEAMEAASKTTGRTVKRWEQMIVAAKRWGLIVDEAKDSSEPA